MVGPPSYVKGVVVKNTTPHAIKLTAVFGSDQQEAEGNARIVETRQIAPDEHVEIEEQTYNMGTWTAIAPLDALHVESDASSNLEATRFTPTANGIVAKLQVEVHSTAHESGKHVLQVVAK